MRRPGGARGLGAGVEIAFAVMRDWQRPMRAWQHGPADRRATEAVGVELVLGEARRGSIAFPGPVGRKLTRVWVHLLFPLRIMHSFVSVVVVSVIGSRSDY